MDNKNSATLRPWSFKICNDNGNARVLIHQEGKLNNGWIADCGEYSENGVSDKNAALIVTSVNNFDALLAACKLANRWLEKLTEDKDFINLDVTLCRLLNLANEVVSKAIANAEKV